MKKQVKKQMKKQSCRKAGIPFVFASYGFGDVPEPDYRISRPADLTKLFG